MNKEKTYIAIDLKSFYASVECIERGLDPLSTNLLVADSSRTEKTICLAVSPSLKSYGISGRARLFEAISQIKRANKERLRHAPSGRFRGSSSNADELKRDPSLAIDFIIATPRMAYYDEYSNRVFSVYLKHVAPEDIHNYSVDEVFIDATSYLDVLNTTPRKFAKMLLQDVLESTGITATAGIGTNLYLSKIAMDIVAKHIEADADGVRIAELNEAEYRRQLWDHRPLTDFWRVGRGISNKLESNFMYTMGDVARCSLVNEDLLYKLFGVNAELLIDHAWGWEPCTIADIKSYKPASNSLSSGQVLQHPYTYDKALLIVKEMTDQLVLDLVDKGLVTDQIVLTVGYDIENLTDPEISRSYDGPITVDYYGRSVPKHAHGTANLSGYTSSTKEIVSAMEDLYHRIVNNKLLVRRMYVVASHIIPENDKPDEIIAEQLSIFSDIEAENAKREKLEIEREKERRMQRTLLDIKKKHGKNSILKGMNLEKGATARERNQQIGGHKA